METILDFFRGADGVTMLSLYHSVLRISLPILALFVVVRSARSLLGFRREPEVWAWLRLSTGEVKPVTHWENVIGRKRNADIVLNFATVSKNHAVLSRQDDGSWSVTDIGGRGRVEVEGQQVLTSPVAYGQTISLGGMEMTLEPVTDAEKQRQSQSRTKAGKGNSPGLTLLLLTVFQSLVLLELLFNLEEDRQTIILAFGILAAAEWVLFIAQKIIKRSGFEVETLAFFLMTIGQGVAASANPDNMIKQEIAMGIGIAMFLFIGTVLRNLRVAKSVRYAAAAAGILLLLANLALGTRINGSKNWIQLGGFTLQPSELVKICFIFAGASTMDKLVTRRNLWGFVLYTAVIGGCLVVMNDFGTAAIFFVGFLAIALLRSSSYPNAALILVGVGMAVVMVLTAILAMKYFPYVKNRFSGYGHIWEDPFGKGYQQTKSLMCIASGGVFGLGLGNGWMHYMAGVGASDTDLVFAYVCEEWGLAMGAMMIVALSLLGLFVVRSARVGRSCFYTIAGSSAMAILLMQAILNVFGTVDFLPLTGVTFPFVSNGGSSMMCCWALMAFIKACDTRRSGSFAVKSAEKGGVNP